MPELNSANLTGFKPDSTVLALQQKARVFLVGGAVRDLLLDRPVHERDWVVQGATPELMLRLGFKPVGADFPVFLHPQTQDEYALARTERKSGKGYKGFIFHADPEVTVQEDLCRRDFTFNAMAMDQHGDLIDPYGGKTDLANGVFRHVSPAFAEDPLRVLRLARFLARYTTFTVHPETMALCRALVEQGELAELVAERVYAEFTKGFKEPLPSRMLSLLSELRAWPELLPQGVDASSATSNVCLAALDKLSTPEHRWSAWLSYFDQVNHALLFHHWRVPRGMQDSTRVLCQIQKQTAVALDDWVAFFAAVDVYRKPERLLDVLRLIWQAGQSVPVGAAWLEKIRMFANQQMDGSFRDGLRQALAAAGGQNPQSTVDAFRRRQIQALFDN